MKPATRYTRPIRSWEKTGPFPAPAVGAENTNAPSSPPSSPPGFPWDHDDALQTASQPRTRTRTRTRTAFSMLGKRKALAPVSDNARPSKRPAVATKQPEKALLTQAQLSLGQRVRKRCNACGMEYVLSSAEDRTLHDRYHKQNTEGYELGKDFLRSTREEALFEGPRRGDAICAVDCRDKSGRKMKARAVLDIAQRELGAVAIDEGDLGDAKKQGDGEPKYRSYMYVRGTKCVGYLLVQRIDDAFEVVGPHDAAAHTTDTRSPDRENAKSATKALQKRRETVAAELRRAEASPIQLASSTAQASLGISRIWTSATHRRQNIATLLLNTALLDHQSHLGNREQSADHEPARRSNAAKVPRRKELVAFSQPTDSGARLARKWFDKAYGWKVYVD